MKQKEQKPKIGSAVLVEKNGKFLLGKRNKKNYKNKWVIPGGGVRFGETIKDAAVREIKEETNLDIEIVKLLCFKEIMNLPEDYHTVVFYYLAKLKNKNKIKVNDDVSEASFFSLDEIKQMNIAESVEWVLRKAGFWNESKDVTKPKTGFFGSAKGIGKFTKEDEMNTHN